MRSLAGSMGLSARAPFCRCVRMGLRTAFLLLFTALAQAAPKDLPYLDRCGELCAQIDSCAKKANRPELGRLLCHMATCEVGKLCRSKEIRSPSGKFRGPFQFTTSTWRGVCGAYFKRDRVAGCQGKKAVYDPCCATMCAAEIIANDLNGGLNNWPVCGKRAKRTVAEENAK